jgi:hypothetical protein
MFLERIILDTQCFLEIYEQVVIIITIIIFIITNTIVIIITCSIFSS